MQYSPPQEAPGSDVIAARRAETESQKKTDTRSTELALLSVGIGIAELMAPGGVARLIGVPNTSGRRNLLRLMGLRELLSGFGILAAPQSTGWICSRLVGDAIDLALLGRSLGGSRTNSTRLISSAAAVIGVTIADLTAAAKLRDHASPQKWAGQIHVERSITVNRSPSEVYEFWRDLENLPQFMSHVHSVSVEGNTSKWRASGPAGFEVEWTADLVLDIPGEKIGWQSREESLVPNQGVVLFRPAPGNRGTEIHVDLVYAPPAGVLGASFAKLFGEEPSQQIAGDLRRLKQVLELGEVVHSDSSIHRGPHAARPSTQLSSSVEVQS
jgi:uncharacterized membrane protein